MPQHPHNGYTHLLIEKIIVGQHSQLRNASFKRVSVLGEPALDLDSTFADQAAFRFASRSAFVVSNIVTSVQ